MEEPHPPPLRSQAHRWRRFPRASAACRILRATTRAGCTLSPLGRLNTWHVSGTCMEVDIAAPFPWRGFPWRFQDCEGHCAGPALETGNFGKGARLNGPLNAHSCLFIVQLIDLLACLFSGSRRLRPAKSAKCSAMTTAMAQAFAAVASPIWRQCARATMLHRRFLHATVRQVRVRPNR